MPQIGLDRKVPSRHFKEINISTHCYQIGVLVRLVIGDIGDQIGEHTCSLPIIWIGHKIDYLKKILCLNLEKIV